MHTNVKLQLHIYIYILYREEINCSRPIITINLLRAYTFNELQWNYNAVNNMLKIEGILLEIFLPKYNKQCYLHM